MIQLQAHRGVCTRYPENTMAAYRGAIREGYDFIELDPRFTKDQQCVLLHDPTVNRTGRTASGAEIAEKTPISDLTLEQALELDFGVWFSEAFRGEKIPMLRDVLRLSKENGVRLKFDSVLQGASEELQEVFFTIAEKEDIGGLLGFTGNRVDWLRKVFERFPKATIHYDGDLTEEAMQELAGFVPHDQLIIWTNIRKMHWLPYPPATKERVESIRRYSRVGLWIADQPEDLEHCEALGADVIETDGTLMPEMRR